MHTYNQGSVYREEWCSNPESNVLRLTHLLLRISSAIVGEKRGGCVEGWTTLGDLSLSRSRDYKITSWGRRSKREVRGHPDQEVTRPKLASITYKNRGMG